MSGDILLRRYRDGAIIFSQGDEPNGMFTILTGKVRIWRGRDGHETTLAILGSGEFFGEMAMFDGKPRSATAQADGPVELRYIDAEEFDRLAGDPFVRRVLGKMAERLRAADESLSKLDAENAARHEYVSHLSVRRDWAV